MDQKGRNRKNLAKWIIGVAAVCILIYLAVRNVGVLAQAVSWGMNVISPLVLGFALAMIINVPMAFFERRLFRPRRAGAVMEKLARPLSIILSVVLVVGILTGVIWLVVPELIDAVAVIINGAVDLLSRVEDMDLSQLEDNPVTRLLVTINWDDLGAQLQNWLTTQGTGLVNTAVGAIGSIVGGVVDFVISFIFAMYILFHKEKLKRQCKRLVRVWLPEGFGEWFVHACRVANKNFRNFVSGQTLEALILGCLCMLGMWILRIPYAPMVGALVGVTALVPVVGGFAGAFVGAFMILTVSPMKALIFLVFLVILQQVEGNLIYPKVMGSKVNLPAMWVLAGVTIGGALAGAIGMLLSVPATATLYVLFREATQQRETVLAARKGEKQDQSEVQDGQAE